MEALGIGFILLWLLIIGIAIVGTIFWIIEIIDVVRREFNDPNMKIIWLLVIIFTHLVGAIIYYIMGRPQGYLPGEQRTS